MKRDKSLCLWELSGLNREKTDADCLGSKNKCSTHDFISHKNDLDLFELSIMVHETYRYLWRSFGHSCSRQKSWCLWYVPSIFIFMNVWINFNSLRWFNGNLTRNRIQCTVGRIQWFHENFSPKFFSPQFFLKIFLQQSSEK